MPEAFDWAKFIQTYQTIIAAAISVLIVVIGWIINHQLTLRAQKKNFLNQVYNSARLEITSTLREYHDNLLNLFVTATCLKDPAASKVNKSGHTIYDEFKKASILKSSWENVLNEYQTLIPELQFVIKRLEYYNTKIHCNNTDLLLIIEGYLNNINWDEANDIIKDDELIAYLKKQAEKVDIDKAIHDEVKYIVYQLGLIDDLIVYIQAKCFGMITGSQLPKEYEANFDRPKFIIKNGKLEYVEGEVEP